MSRRKRNKSGGSKATADERRCVSLPVIPGGGTADAGARSGGGVVRKSRTARWRAFSLILVHVLMIAHGVQWLITGRTVSPIEPSESMYTLNRGELNAGFIFFGVAILATALLGRFVCGWGCHLVAYQDAASALLKRLGIKPKPFRSRFLFWAPLVLALYMFVWPTVYRLWFGIPAPELSNHLITTDFWKTFPGVGIAVLTVLLCGFAIVYLLGSKGFCTYACPYGGFFVLAERVAPGRIVVDANACEGCGHCTAVCSSNVRVHEEVDKFGMVVDPGCMKCMDCVSVCPKDALSFGFARPSLGAKPASPVKPRVYDFSLGEEVLLFGVALVALLIYRGLYGLFPLLLSMGMAGMTGYLVLKGWRLIRDSNVRLQSLTLKRGCRLTGAGFVFACFVAVLVLGLAHSGVVRASSFAGRRAIADLSLSDDVWLSPEVLAESLPADERRDLERAANHLRRADAWGLLPVLGVLEDRVWAELALGRVDEAERAVRRIVDAWGDSAESYRGLAGVLRKKGEDEAAFRAYEKALSIDPDYATVRAEFGAMLIELGQLQQAAELYEGRDDVAPAARVNLGLALLRTNALAAGEAQLVAALEADPTSADAHYNLGLVNLQSGRRTEAIDHLSAATESDPSLGIAWYNLAVATFMDARPAEALPAAKRASDLMPNDPDAFGFLAVIHDALGNIEAAEEARRRAIELSPGQE